MLYRWRPAHYRQMTCRPPGPARASTAGRPHAASGIGPGGQGEQDRVSHSHIRAAAGGALDPGEETLNHTLPVCHEAAGGSVLFSGRRTGAWRRWARIVSAQVSSAAVT